MSRYYVSNTKTTLIFSSLVLLSACSGSGPSERENTTSTGASTGASTGSESTTGQDGVVTTTGTDTTGSTTTGSDDPPPPYAPPQGMLRRLTRPQFVNAMKDVFGVELDRAALDADSYNGDFAAVGASSVVTSARGVEQYNAAVESAVEEVFKSAESANAFIGCTPAAIDDACATDYLKKLGRRAWRRPLETSELDQLFHVARTVETELEDLTEAMRWATVALFSSPYFIYRPELGSATADGLKVTGYEMASRLAFLIWNSLPDDVLLDEAAAGSLDTPAGIQNAARRMLTDSAGRESVGAFAEDYMRLDRVLTQAKDPILFPEYTPALQQAMVEDVRQVWEIVVLDEDASALSVFSTNKVVANAELAKLYGLDSAGLDSDTFKQFELPEAGPRLGVLAKSGFLSQFANQKEGSPTLRGKFMREALMCETVSPPPPGLALELPEPPSDQPMTKRQRLEKHREDAICKNCHEAMDPLGLPFESFDAIGKYRTTDHGLPVDSSGEFDDIPVADSAELGRVMSSSELVAQCLVKKYYSYALGHEERDVDESVVDALGQSFTTSGYRLKQLILDLVASEAFSAVAPQSDL